MSGNMVQGDPDEIEALAKQMQGVADKAREMIQQVGGNLRNAQTWKDQKHAEICTRYDEATTAALRSLQTLKDEVAPRMRTLAQKLREARQA